MAARPSMRGTSNSCADHAIPVRPMRHEPKGCVPGMIDNLTATLIINGMMFRVAPAVRGYGFVVMANEDPGLKAGTPVRLEWKEPSVLRPTGQHQAMITERKPIGPLIEYTLVR